MANYHSACPEIRRSWFLEKNWGLFSPQKLWSSLFARNWSTWSRSKLGHEFQSKQKGPLVLYGAHRSVAGGTPVGSVFSVGKPCCFRLIIVKEKVSDPLYSCCCRSKVDQKLFLHFFQYLMRSYLASTPDKVTRMLSFCLESCSVLSPFFTPLAFPHS